MNIALGLPQGTKITLDRKPKEGLKTDKIIASYRESGKGDWSGIVIM